MASSSHDRETTRLQHMINGLVIVIYVLIILLGLALLCVAMLMSFVQP